MIKSTTVKKIKIPFDTSFRESQLHRAIDTLYWNGQAEQVNKTFANFGIRLNNGILKDNELRFYVEGLTPELVEEEKKFKGVLLQLHLKCRDVGFYGVKIGVDIMQKLGEISQDAHLLYYVAVDQNTENLRLNPKLQAESNDRWMFIFFFASVLFLFYYLFNHQLIDEAEPWKKIQFIVLQLTKRIWNTATVIPMVIPARRQ